MQNDGANASDARRFRCRNCPLSSFRGFKPLTQQQVDFVEKFKSGEIHTAAGATLFLEGTTSPYLYTVVSGWAFRYKMLPDGRRQILNFVLPGDLLGLQSAVAGEMQHSVETLTDLALCTFPRDKIWSLFSGHPDLAFDLTWLAAREEQMLDEHLLAVGQRTATERAAYLLLHLFTRAEEVGLIAKDSLETPFNQQHLADALGLSLVHTNRVLRRLVARKLIRWTQGVLAIDREGLKEASRFNPDEPVRRAFL